MMQKQYMTIYNIYKIFLFPILHCRKKRNKMLAPKLWRDSIHLHCRVISLAYEQFQNCTAGDTMPNESTVNLTQPFYLRRSMDYDPSGS